MSNKLFESILKLNEAFTDEELDMDENEWLEQMKAARAKQIQDRQAKRDAEEKAKKEAEEKAARLARGEFTEDEKKWHRENNWDLLQKYIDSMKDDMFSILRKALSPIDFEEGAPGGFCPQGTDLYCPPIYIEGVKSERDDEETNEMLLSSDFDYYDGQLCFYPTFYKDELTSYYCNDGKVEADDWHSGSRNIKAWQEYFVEGNKEFKDINEIHNILDSDAELFQCIRWQYWECLGVILAGGCISRTNSINEAAEMFYNTNYGSNFNREPFMFIEYASAFYTEETIENFRNTWQK